MSVRGRITVAVLLAVGVSLAGLALRAVLGSPDPPSQAIAPPSGEAAQSEEEELPRTPAQLIARLPAGADSFESSVVGASQSPVGWVEVPDQRTDIAGPLRVEYSMDVELTRRIFKLLRRGRVSLGHVIVMDPATGRIIAYASTDPDGFPATRAYPAASLVKVVTAAAALRHAPEDARRPCRYRGNPYRLSRSRIHRPSSGHEISLERALASSNNQCFAQLAVDTIGGGNLLATFARFGLMEAPAPGHAPGIAQLGSDEYDLAKLGSGLGGCRITPLHAAQLAATLAKGQRIEPWWVDRVVDARGRVLPLPYRRSDRRVMSSRVAAELREMLVRTTTRGTAMSAFRDRRGRPLLGPVTVAGKTGNLSGKDPSGRYEWFIGVAPANSPTVAVSVLQVQGHLWWRKSSQLAADVLKEVFCEGRSCSPDLATRYTGGIGDEAASASRDGSSDRLAGSVAGAEGG